jgi:hypothetical protein
VDKGVDAVVDKRGAPGITEAVLCMTLWMAKESSKGGHHPLVQRRGEAVEMLSPRETGTSPGENPERSKGREIGVSRGYWHLWAGRSSATRRITGQAG